MDGPLVLDADGLNAIGQNHTALKSNAGRILTPHPGEFARLTGQDVKTVQANRRDLAQQFARDNGVVLVLKRGRNPVYDGQRIYQNIHRVSGNGDGRIRRMGVLTGLIAVFVGLRGLEPSDAAQLRLYLR